MTSPLPTNIEECDDPSHSQAGKVHAEPACIRCLKCEKNIKAEYAQRHGETHLREEKRVKPDPTPPTGPSKLSAPKGPGDTAK